MNKTLHLILRNINHLICDTLVHSNDTRFHVIESQIPDLIATRCNFTLQATDPDPVGQSSKL